MLSEAFQTGQLKTRTKSQCFPWLSFFLSFGLFLLFFIVVFIILHFCLKTIRINSPRNVSSVIIYLYQWEVRGSFVVHKILQELHNKTALSILLNN